MYTDTGNFAETLAAMALNSTEYSREEIDKRMKRNAIKAKKDAIDEQRQQRTLRPWTVGPDLSQMHTLEDFGYRFNRYGELRNIETDSRFKFEAVPYDHSYNERHYEALGDIITEHVFELMESVCHLQKTPVPVDASVWDPKTFIFVSDNVLPIICSNDSNSNKKLLVLIHGSGVVRAGQWARRLIINNNLDQGTMIPYITRAKQEGYEVMLLNTNIHRDIFGRRIKCSSSPESHGRYVWKHLISKWPGKVAIVAHSAGGCVTLNMAKRCNGFMDKVFAVGFTDSAHTPYMSRDVSNWLKKHSKNWVSSRKPLDTNLDPRWRNSGDCPRVSAGTSKHEETSYYSMESIFRFFGQMERVTRVSPKPFRNKQRQRKAFYV